MPKVPGTRKNEDSSLSNQRIRRDPETARAALLDAAVAALETAELGALTVEAITRPAGMTRSAFYHYFSGIDEVVLELLERYEHDIRATVDPWLKGNAQMADYRGATISYLTDMYAVMRTHYNTLRAVTRAASASRTVFDEWQARAIDYYVEITAVFIREQIALGRSQIADPDAVARALILMNTSVSMDSMQREQPDDPTVIGRTVGGIWNVVIYGPGSELTDAQ